MKSASARTRWQRITCLGGTALTSVALAQNPGPPMPATATPSDTPYRVVISARRTAQPLSGVLADTTLIDRTQIERSGAASIGDLLQRQHGIELSRSGGPGTQTGIFMRGADNRFTAVYVDGVRVDTQATGGAPWEAISLAQVDRIEIVRGPAAAVYGSDAVAGVIQVFTRRGEGPAQPYAAVGAGSHQRRQLQTGVSGGDDRIDYSLGVTREGSRGFNAMPAGNPDRDGWRQNSANARLGWQVHAAHRIDFTGTYTDMDAQYDADPAFDPDALVRHDRASNRLGTAGITWSARWNDRYSTRVAINQSSHRYDDPPSAYTSRTQLRNFLWHNEWQAGNHLLSADLERREDRLDNAPINQGRHQDALALGYSYQGSRHSLQVNARRDQDSEFGGQSSGSVAYGLRLADNWRATLSVATAFRAPTLYQTQFAAPGLGPEKSRNLEAGIHWSHGRSGADLVLYHNRIRNLIDWDPSTPCEQPLFGGCYVNTGRANLRGASLSARHALGTVNVSASLDWQQPTNADTGKLLARRARRQIKLNADTRAAGWTLGAEWLATSQRWDDAANTRRLAGYGLLNVYAHTTIARDWDLLLRVDNVANRRYELAGGYAAPPLQAFAQLRWTPR
ncbi:MAG: TonB-dependent receptor [Ottowia sp.]|nr:TonB-dependent receptor [Ottowia sp.]